MTAPSTTDASLLPRLRVGDDLAFRELVALRQPTMTRLASSLLRSQAVADEVVSETWIAVIHAIAGSDHRLNLDAWMIRPLVSIARSKQVDAGGVVLDFHGGNDGDVESVRPDRFVVRSGQGEWGHPPDPWSSLPNEVVASAIETAVLVDTIKTLPESQIVTVVLRDVDGWSPGEVRAVTDDLRVHSRSQRKRRCRVPEIMQPDRR